MTRIDQLLAHAAQIDSPTAQLDAELLLAFVLEKPRSYLYTWPDKTVTEAQVAAFMTLLERRQRGEPVGPVAHNAHAKAEKTHRRLDHAGQAQLFKRQMPQGVKAEPAVKIVVVKRPQQLAGQGLVFKLFNAAHKLGIVHMLAHPGQRLFGTGVDARGLAARRQRKADAGAAVGRVGSADLPAVRFDDRPADRQPQPDAGDW